MYSIIDYYWIILISFAILVLCYFDQIYTESKFVILDIELSFDLETSQVHEPDVPNVNQFSLKSLKKTLTYYIMEKPTAFMLGLVLIVIYSFLFPFISSNLWVGMYDHSEGLVFNDVVVSTYFSRFLDK